MTRDKGLFSAANARGRVDPMPAAIAALRAGAEPVWLFAYGSLMWQPDFAYVDAQVALLHGYHRSFCLYSYDYRGTFERPGLVLGLDRGGACRGIAFRLAPHSLAASIDRVWAREMTDRVYEMRRVRVRLAAGVVPALACVIRREHADYAGRLAPEAAARLILDAVGSRGACRDYLASTLRHLDELGLADAALRRLDRRVRELAAARACGS
jgi:glutathione-specific gamma-glutamylcyclotransferase